jgi:hypothetical protein
MPQVIRKAQILISFALTLLPMHLLGQNNVPNAKSQITAQQILDKVAAANTERARNLVHFDGRRKYELIYRGFPGNRQAEMQVDVSFTTPSTKDFKVVSSAGSKVIIDRVFHKLLDSEREAAAEENQQRSALTNANYEAQLIGAESRDSGPAYVLAVKPRTRNKFLYRGKVWIDGNDFAVTRIEAEPAQNPSFWISRTEILHEYRKIGDFWLPANHRSVTHVRLGGQATLTINYDDYKIVSVVSQSNHVDSAQSLIRVDADAAKNH